jgi:hypothetical protein
MLSAILLSLSLPVIIFTIVIYDYNTQCKIADPILLLKIPWGTRKNSPANYPQFGYALSKWFCSHGLDLD